MSFLVKEKCIKYLFPFLIILSFSLPGFSDVNNVDLWQRIALEIPINDYTLKFHNENRFNDIWDNFERTHFEGSFEIPFLTNGISVEPAFRYIALDGNRNPTLEYDLNLNYKIKKIFNTDWEFKFRNRWVSIDNHEKNDWFYQTRFAIKLAHPIPINGHNDKPLKFWIYEEIFYKFWLNNIGENRARTGITVPIMKNTDLDIGVQWKSKKSSNGWDDSYQALISIKYKFPKKYYEL